MNELKKIRASALELKNNVWQWQVGKSRKPVTQYSEVITTRVGTMEKQDNRGIDWYVV